MLKYDLTVIKSEPWRFLPEMFCTGLKVMKRNSWTCCRLRLDKSFDFRNLSVTGKKIFRPQFCQIAFAEKIKSGVLAIKTFFFSRFIQVNRSLTHIGSAQSTYVQVPKQHSAAKIGLEDPFLWLPVMWPCFRCLNLRQPEPFEATQFV